MAVLLWDQLGEATPQHHQRSVELFYQLHNLVPSSSICENVISNQLMHRDKVGLFNMHKWNKCVYMFSSLHAQPSLFILSEDPFRGSCEIFGLVASNPRPERQQAFTFQPHL